MATKFNFSDIKIGDLVLTTNNKIGEVIALKSYAYLNNKFEKKSNPENTDEKEAEKPVFKVDNTRHNGVWYSAITVIIEDKDAGVPTYYEEGLDFIEIREIIKHDENKKESWFDKLKNFNI